MNAAISVLKDWSRGFAFWSYWWRFGLLDISLRYRRTYLGPIWITLTFAITAGMLGLVYSTLFAVDTREYIPYLVTGLAVWMFVSGLISEGCTILIQRASVIREHKLPLLVHAIRTVVTATVIFLHNAVVIIATVLIFRGHLPATALLAVVGILVIAFNGVWMTLLFGLICARFRDLPPLITTIVNVSFLVTPVFWYSDMLRSRPIIVDANPFFHFIELVRAPMLGELPGALTVGYVATVTCAGWLTTLVLATRLQPRLAYWV